MKATNLPTNLDLLLSKLNSYSGLVQRVMAVLVLVGLLAVSLHLSSSASELKSVYPNQGGVPATDGIRAPLSLVELDGFFQLGSFPALAPLPQAGVNVATYASDCMTPKSVFNLQDSDLTVCAKVTGFDPSWVVIWSNANFVQVQNASVGTGESTFTLSAASSLGDWRVILYEPFGGSVYALTRFTVVDAANPAADLTITNASLANSVAAGSQAVFAVQLTNLGPSDAIDVEITNNTPANTTFASFAQVSGPSGFSCINPGIGNTGTTTCTVANLARGDTAIFLAVYDVAAGVTPNTVISTSATVSSDTPDLKDENNSSNAEVVVLGVTAETCTLDCPTNVVVTANTTSGGQPGAFVSFAGASVAGNCGAVTNTPSSGSFFTVGTHSVVSSAEFGGSCAFTVTVLDTSPPTITCPTNVTVTAPDGASEVSIDPGTPTINASGGGTVTGVRSDDLQLTDPYPIGTTGITWTVTDAGGRTASCSQVITVLAEGDREPVTISCPANVTVNAPLGQCLASISLATIGTPSTNHDSDVVVSPRRSDDLPLTDPFPAGTTTITWIATDSLNGSIASCVQIVFVDTAGSDTTPPMLVVPPNVTATTSSCTATLDDELGIATAEDNCSSSVNISRAGVPANFNFPTGTTTIIYTATDAAGNTATGLQLVTVTESPAIPPTITAPTDVTANTGPGATTCGTVVDDATLGAAIANDNCPGVTVTRTGVPAGNLFPVGMTTVTYTATDASGNVASDTQTVTVMDNTPPTITCPANIVLEPTCPTGAVATWTAPLTSDNCPGATITQTGGPASGSVFPVGMTTITYTANDAHGNSASCSFTVTVLTAQATVQNMIDAVNALQPPLSGQQAQGLRSKLQAALDAINTGKTNVACNKLGDFISQLQGLINNGTLTSAQGQPLINSAAKVRNHLGCTSFGCT